MLLALKAHPSALPFPPVWFWSLTDCPINHVIKFSCEYLNTQPACSLWAAATSNCNLPISRWQKCIIWVSLLTQLRFCGEFAIPPPLPPSSPRLLKLWNYFIIWQMQIQITGSGNWLYKKHNTVKQLCQKMYSQILQYIKHTVLGTPMWFFFSQWTIIEEFFKNLNKGPRPQHTISLFWIVVFF